MSTPESKVKEKVKAGLKRLCAYWHMPVQNGMGSPSLDFNCCVPLIITSDMVGRTIGTYVAIETKAPGKKLTPRQLNTKAAIEAAHGKVLVIDGDLEQLEHLRMYI